MLLTLVTIHYPIIAMAEEHHTTTVPLSTRRHRGGVLDAMHKEMELREANWFKKQRDRQR